MTLCRQSEQSGVDTAKPAVSNSSKSEPSRDAQKLAQWPGGRMIFALQSMAKRMSPVLSSYVMPQQHQPVSQQEGLHGSSDTQGMHILLQSMLVTLHSMRVTLHSMHITLQKH